MTDLTGIAMEIQARQRAIAQANVGRMSDTAWRRAQGLTPEGEVKRKTRVIDTEAVLDAVSRASGVPTCSLDDGGPPSHTAARRLVRYFCAMLVKDFKPGEIGSSRHNVEKAVRVVEELLADKNQMYVDIHDAALARLVGR